jgi:hypothetical protein
VASSLLQQFSLTEGGDPVTSLQKALEASELLRDKVASLRSDDPKKQSLREKAAAADFAAFAAIKQAGAEELWQLGKKPLAWGLGLGLPALGAGHALISDAHAQGKDLIRDARNQALLTSLGVGGMQALGGLLSQQPPQVQQQPQDMSYMPDAGVAQMDAVPPGQEQAKLSALVMVDDLLEDAYEQLSGREKRAALAHLVAHRMTSMRVVRSLLK